MVQLVFKLKGEKQLLSEVFATDTIGNWNPADEPIDFIEFTNADRSAFQFANGNLTALGDELRELADAAFKADLTGTVPVLTNIVRAPKLESIHDDDELASATRWRVSNRVRPHPPLTIEKQSAHAVHPHRISHEKPGRGASSAKTQRSARTLAKREPRPQREPFRRGDPAPGALRSRLALRALGHLALGTWRLALGAVAAEHAIHSAA